MGEQVVLFGGSFNPIHHGHLIVARAVAEHFGFGRITLVPAALSPHKTADRCDDDGLVQPTAEDRLEMARLAVAGEGLFDVSDVDVRRAPPSFTCETLRAVGEVHGSDAELQWIIGADMLADLPTWRNAEEVVQLARIITAARPGQGGAAENILENLRKQLPGELVERLAEGIVETPLVDISSTDIRRRVAEGRSIRFLTPDSVINYVSDGGLYARRSD